MINLTNYEEYFLLYIDNELSKEQCEAVDAFVLQHPHLAAELDMLQDTKLPQEETVIFNDKAALYKTANSSININNYEEYFLLHTDNELLAKEEAEVEQFVLQHPQLQEEFLLIQQAKLVPETIECPDKQRLYKQPGRRVVPLYFTRVAVAATVAGIVVMTGYFLMNTNQQPIANNAAQRQQQPVEQQVVPQKSIGQNNTALATTEKKNSDEAITKSETKQIVAKVKIIDNKKESLPDNKSSDESKTAQIKIDALSNVQQATQAPEENAMAAANTAPKQPQATALKPLEEVDEKEDAASVMYAANDYATAKPAVYKELNTDEDEQTLYVGSLQLNKAKVNGLLKKATHLLGNKTKESSL